MRACARIRRPSPCARILCLRLPHAPARQGVTCRALSESRVSPCRGYGHPPAYYRYFQATLCTGTLCTVSTGILHGAWATTPASGRVAWAGGLGKRPGQAGQHPAAAVAGGMPMLPQAEMDLLYSPLYLRMPMLPQACQPGPDSRSCCGTSFQHGLPHTGRACRMTDQAQVPWRTAHAHVEHSVPEHQWLRYIRRPCARP